MDIHRHHVSGFFAQRDEAEATFATLVTRGLAREQLQIFDTKRGAAPLPASTPHQAPPEAGSDAALKDILVDGAIGTAVGTGLGALAQVALVAANVSLFIASPLIAPLVMMGWGASLGGLLGAANGAIKKETGGTAASIEEKTGWLSTLIGDAIASGQFVLVAQTNTEQETAIAQEVIEASVGSYKDDSIA
ncbi:MAG: hypothetical protein Q7T62_01975 [Undibacterium sp.]|nr:hypothetical protein [Undibacterium sp.]